MEEILVCDLYDVAAKHEGIFSTEVDFSTGNHSFKKGNKKYNQAQLVLSHCCPDKLTKVPELSEKRVSADLSKAEAGIIWC